MEMNTSQQIVDHSRKKEKKYILQMQINFHII